MRHHVSLLLIVFSLVLQNVQSQLSLVKNEDCGENETFQTCGTACEPSCDTPSQSFCTLQCVVGCQCDKGFLRNSNKECVSADKCSTTNNTSTHAPASTTGATVALNCSRNEVASDCHNPCTEKKCPKENPVMVNCLMMCQHGCSCKDGFVRNDQGECVDESTCPPVITNSTENQCNLVDCRTGTQCEIQNGQAVCVKPPRQSSITCANVRCGSRGGCAMVEPAGCQGNCQLAPQCVDVNVCLTHQCKTTEECVHVQPVCIKAPCNPIAECRSRIKPLTLPRINRSARLATPSGPSCMTARCGTPAGCAMVKPSHCGDSKDCQLKPMCLHENACASTSCLVGTECVLHEVTCIRAPCNPIAQCEEQEKSSVCGANERFAACLTSCSDSKCNEEPKLCPQVCSGAGCICQTGFFRNASGNCVTQNDCDAEKKQPY